MKKSLFCLLLTSVISLSACMGADGSASSLETNETQSSSFDASFFGEKVADEAAWQAAFENIDENYTVNGVQIFDGETEKLLVKVDGNTAMVEIGSQDGEQVKDYGVFIEGNLYHYNEQTMLWEERNNNKGDWNQFIHLANNTLSLVAYSDFSYEQESGLYKAVKEMYGMEMTFYVKIVKGKVKNVKYTMPYGDENIWLDFVFGETEIELPAGVPENKN